MFVLSRSITVFAALALPLAAEAQVSTARLRVTVTLPATLPGGPPAPSTGIDGRLFVIFSTDSSAEPRYQVSYGAAAQPAFAMDVTGWKPGETRTLDPAAFGFPVPSLGALPRGSYRVQALLTRYETFHRADGTTVSLPPDQGEGQHWNVKPGNFYSVTRTMTVDPSRADRLQLTVDQVIPPVPPFAETPYVKYVRIRSERLSRF